MKFEVLLHKSVVFFCISDFESNFHINHRGSADYRYWHIPSESTNSKEIWLKGRTRGMCNKIWKFFSQDVLYSVTDMTYLIPDIVGFPSATFALFNSQYSAYMTYGTDIHILCIISLLKIAFNMPKPRQG